MRPACTVTRQVTPAGALQLDTPDHVEAWSGVIEYEPGVHVKASVVPVLLMKLTWLAWLLAVRSELVADALLGGGSAAF